MDKAVFDDYVESRYKKQMAFYSEASKKNKKIYRMFQWALIILSAITPVLAALTGKHLTIKGEDHPIDLQNWVIIVSAIVAILTTGLKTFTFQELWISYRSTYEKLKPEIHYYHFSVGPYAATDIDKESLFVARVEALLDTEHMQWPAAKKLLEDQARAKAQELQPEETADDTGKPGAAKPDASQTISTESGTDTATQTEAPDADTVINTSPQPGADEPDAGETGSSETETDLPEDTSPRDDEAGDTKPVS